MWFAEDVEVCFVPEGATVVYFDDVVDVDHSRFRHVVAASGACAASTVSGDYAGSEFLPPGGVVAGIVQGRVYWLLTLRPWMKPLIKRKPQ